MLSWLEPVGAVLWQLRLPLALYLTAVLFCWVLVELIRAIISQVRAASTEKRYRRASLADIDKMADRDFVRYLAFLFNRAGFSVQFTPPAGNYGVDLVLLHPGTEERISVHARRSAEPVSLPSVRQAQAARAYYDCTRSIIVSNGAFDEAAQEAAQFCAVSLVDRAKLQELIGQILPYKPRTTESRAQTEPTEVEGARA